MFLPQVGHSIHFVKKSRDKQQHYVCHKTCMFIAGNVDMHKVAHDGLGDLILQRGLYHDMHPSAGIHHCVYICLGGLHVLCTHSDLCNTHTTGTMQAKLFELM